MGYGYIILSSFILVVFSGLLLFFLLGFLLRKHTIGKIILSIATVVCYSVIGLILCAIFMNWFFSKTELDKEDYYGEYVVKRGFFKGEQTDWQYNHYRFEITEKDSIFFYVTDKEKIIKTYRGTISTTDRGQYKSARLRIEMEDPTHHILMSNPTSYRDSFTFYLVFNSPLFNNVFFEKRTWGAID